MHLALNQKLYKQAINPGTGGTQKLLPGTRQVMKRKYEKKKGEEKENCLFFINCLSFSISGLGFDLGLEASLGTSECYLCLHITLLTL